MTEPTTYYSFHANQWSLINQAMPACKLGSFEDAQRCAAAYKLKPAEVFWNGDAGEFQPLKPADSLQAAEAAAFSLMPTENQPRTTSAQNPLF